MKWQSVVSRLSVHKKSIFYPTLTNLSEKVCSETSRLLPGGVQHLPKKDLFVYRIQERKLSKSKWKKLCVLFDPMVWWKKKFLHFWLHQGKPQDLWWQSWQWLWWGGSYCSHKFSATLQHSTILTSGHRVTVSKHLTHQNKFKDELFLKTRHINSFFQELDHKTEKIYVLSFAVIVTSTWGLQ